MAEEGCQGDGKVGVGVAVGIAVGVAEGVGEARREGLGSNTPEVSEGNSNAPGSAFPAFLAERIMIMAMSAINPASMVRKRGAEILYFFLAMEINLSHQFEFIIRQLFK